MMLAAPCRDCGTTCFFPLSAQTSSLFHALGWVINFPFTRPTGSHRPFTELLASDPSPLFQARGFPCWRPGSGACWGLKRPERASSPLWVEKCHFPTRQGTWPKIAFGRRNRAPAPADFVSISLFSVFFLDKTFPARPYIFFSSLSRSPKAPGM